MLQVLTFFIFLHNINPNDLTHIAESLLERAGFPYFIPLNSLIFRYLLAMTDKILILLPSSIQTRAFLP